MSKPKMKLSNFFNNDEDDDLLTQQSLAEQKRAHYAHGTVRKSKREKEKEKEEQKKREEEELNAKTYAEFLDAFDGDGVQKKGGFVKAGGSGSAPVFKPTFESSGRRMDNRGRSPSPPMPNFPRPKGKRAMDAFLEEIKRDQAEREARLSRHSQTQGRSVTALAAYEGQSGSKDRGDPLTSNVFVANLPSNVTEQSLGNFFASRCGPVGSVKIMWPRGEGPQGPGTDLSAASRAARKGLSGFVSFMKRKDAETAVREMDGFDWGGYVLRVGWSKAVPLAAKATYTAQVRLNSRSPERDRGSGGGSGSGGRDNRWQKSRSRSRDRDRHRSRSESRGRGGGDKGYSPRRRSRSYSRSRSRKRRSRSYSRSRRYSESRSRSRSRSPKRLRSESPIERGLSGVDVDTENFIKTVASKVKEHGEPFEDILLERERENPKFAFLFDQTSPENRLYRSLIDGQSLIQAFEDDGYNSVYSTDSGEESERERVKKTKLGKLARRRFEAMLRSLSGKNAEIARCMTFCLEHAEAASEVTDIIVASLLVDSTPVPRKVARLHLICDILHNSAASVPNAWKYRQEFQSRLGIVFDHLSSIYHSFPGRMTAETFKQQIVAVLSVWEDWIVFPPEFTSALKNRLEGVSSGSAGAGADVNKEKEQAETEEERDDRRAQAQLDASKFRASAFKPATDPVPAPAVVNVQQVSRAVDSDEDMEVDSDAEANKRGGDDVDGDPIDDVDGEPLELDGDPIDVDVDGEPIGEDIDGDPVDDNVDGESLDVDGEPI